MFPNLHDATCANRYDRKGPFVFYGAVAGGAKGKRKKTSKGRLSH